MGQSKHTSSEHLCLHHLDKTWQVYEWYCGNCVTEPQAVGKRGPASPLGALKSTRGRMDA